MNALANNATRQADAYCDELEAAISDAKTIEKMEGEYSPIEYRRMAELEASDDAVAFCDYRKQCRRSLLRSWFTTAEQISDYVNENNPRKNILGGWTV